mgnify:CR=1 FL=1
MFESQVQPSATLDSTQSQDTTKPETQLSISGTQGENNWYISDVQITLTATDDNSGILKTEYSLDNGQSWNVYTSPFAIAQEGTVAVLYKSIDKAGNVEIEKTSTVKIDKTPPEAKLSLDVDSFDLRIEGVDNSSTTAAFIYSNAYQIKDGAGHTLTLNFKKLKDQKRSLHLSLESMQYDAAPVVSLPKNELNYEWAIDKKLDEIRVLHQELAVKLQLYVAATFKQKKNETEIRVVQGTKKDKTKEKTAAPGSVVIKLTTDKGQLGLDY